MNIGPHDEAPLVACPVCGGLMDATAALCWQCTALIDDPAYLRRLLAFGDDLAKIEMAEVVW